VVVVGYFDLEGEEKLMRQQQQQQQQREGQQAAAAALLSPLGLFKSAAKALRGSGSGSGSGSGGGGSGAATTATPPVFGAVYEQQVAHIHTLLTDKHSSNTPIVQVRVLSIRGCVLFFLGSARIKPFQPFARVCTSVCDRKWRWCQK
jgi:hypothetical protein